jgi:hypothetical protein
MVSYADAPALDVAEPGRWNVGLWVPKRHALSTRLVLETRRFDDRRVAELALWERYTESREEHRFKDPALARMAHLARHCRATSFISYATPSTNFTSTGASPQTAVGVGTVGVTDFIVLALGYSIWLGGTAGAAGAPLRLFSCTYATNPPGTNSTTAGPTQRGGRVIAATNLTSGVNWTAEPTVKTYIEAPGDLQPFGGGQRFDESPDLARAPDFALASGYGLECNTAAAVAMTASTIFCRN